MSRAALPHNRHPMAHQLPFQLQRGLAALQRMSLRLRLMALVVVALLPVGALSVWSAVLKATLAAQRYWR